MNYEESTQILKEIKKAKKILVNCHRSPDADGVGSSLALYLALKKMGKEVKVVCPSNLREDLKFLLHSEVIEKINFKKFDFKDYDLFFCLDSAGPNMVTGDEHIPLPKIPIILIDHHKTNPKFGKINMVDSKVSSTAEIIYLIFEDWKVKIDKDIATLLFSGILSDTGIFQYPGVTGRTFKIAEVLMEKGADKDEIIFRLARSYSFKEVKLWGEILARIKKDESYKFVWSAVPHEIYEKYSKPEGTKESAANLFAPIINDTDFGMVMVEETKGTTTVSLRSRTGFDVSKIALALGGGGHNNAAGGKVSGLSFDEAVEKILRTAREVVDENRNKN